MDKENFQDEVSDKWFLLSDFSLKSTINHFDAHFSTGSRTAKPIRTDPVDHWTTDAMSKFHSFSISAILELTSMGFKSGGTRWIHTFFNVQSHSRCVHAFEDSSLLLQRAPRV